MSKKAMPVYELATEIMACYGRQCAAQDAIALITHDRATARAEGEAVGYARAVEEIATFVFDEYPLESGRELIMAAAIRAKFGGK